MNPLEKDALDQKVTSVFAGRVVRKDLVRTVKVGANVPVFVLEFLLGTYCASDDPYAIEAGLKIVNSTLSENFVRPDESTKAQSLVRERGKHMIIDKIKVRYVSEDDKYWAELVNFGHKFVHIPEKYVTQFDRLLLGGIWAQVTIRHMYDEEATGKRSPFWIDDLKPIQLASFDLDEYKEGRKAFTTEEWIDFLIRSLGMQPSEFDRRLKMLYLLRLVPFCEHNYNLIELGPRGTGKSYAYQEISPYGILLTGPTTVANLFYNMSTGKMGLIGLWDVVAFDEVADLQKMPKEIITMLKTYCESGSFARGREQLAAYASFALFGNTNQPIDVMVKSSHLFMPMPDIIRNDMAFIDRIHSYLPGWEIPKMQTRFFTSNYGFVVDYFAEAIRELRKQNFTDAIDQYFSFGSHLNARDVKAVRKTVSGMMKLLYPHGEYTREELAEVLELSLECRRRVKEQLKKMGSFEYYQTSFSYIDNETREEVYVGVPEEGGRGLISPDPLAPGSVYCASVDMEGKVGLNRIEVGMSVGTGKLKFRGGIAGSMKESVQRAFSYIESHKVEMGIGHEFDTSDFHVEAIDLIANKVPCDAGVAFVIALFSAVRSHPVRPSLVILGDISVQGNIKALPSLVEILQTAMDNGGKGALIPVENKRTFLEVSAEILEQVDPIFYSDPITAAMKALGLH
jgi:ATP-dependent Lon protease